MAEEAESNTETRNVEADNAFAKVCYFDKVGPEEKVQRLADAFLECSRKSSPAEYKSFIASVNSLFEQNGTALDKIFRHSGYYKSVYVEYAELLGQSFLKKLQESPEQEEKTFDSFGEEFDIFKPEDLGDMYEEFSNLDTQEELTTIHANFLRAAGDSYKNNMKALLERKGEMMLKGDETLDVYVDTLTRLKEVFELLLASVKQATLSVSNERDAGKGERWATDVEASLDKIVKSITNSEAIRRNHEARVAEFNKAAKIWGVPPLEKKPPQSPPLFPPFTP